MSTVCYFLNQRIRLGASHVKNVSSLTNQSWSLAPLCWGIKFQSPPQWGMMPFSSKPATIRHTSHLIFADESIAKYLGKDAIPWKEVKAIIFSTPELGVKNTNINAAVLQSCIHSDLLDVAISYYKDVISNGGKFSMLEYSLLIKLMASKQKQISEKYEDLARELFQIFKPHIQSHKVLQSDCLKLFSCVKDLWHELVNMCQGNELVHGTQYVVRAAFDFGEPDIAWKLLNQFPDIFNAGMVKCYLNYCIRKAGTNKFSISMINDLVHYCQEFVTVIPYSDLYDSLKTLVSILNKRRNAKYKWAVEKSVVSNNSICSECCLKLSSVTITEAEYNELQLHILNNIFNSENCFIKTSHDEVRAFLSFLTNSSNYNYVIDGMNFLYKQREKGGPYDYQKLFDFLEGRRKKILFIGKKHLLRHPAYPIIKRNCQVFLVDNLSDDDIFVIYAALKGGMETNFLTGDFYRGYRDYFKKHHIKRIFLKWLLSHQNFLSESYKILSPPIHSYLPQITRVPSPLFEKGQLSWHLSSQPTPSPKILVPEGFYWVCLKAVPI